MMLQALAIFIFLFSSCAFAWNYTVKNTSQTLHQYLRLQKKFSKKMCGRGQDHKYYDLLKDYRGAGHYVPVLGETKLDREAIKSLLGEFDLKIQWIEQQLEYLEKQKKLPNVKTLTFFVEKSLSELLIIKEYYDREKNVALKRKYSKKSAEVMKRLKAEFDRMLLTIPFLKSYRFPINFFELRKTYDQFKDQEDIAAQKKSNKTYLYRKIVEDGTFNSQKRRGDKYIRALINTLSLRLAKGQTYLSDDIRYDLDDLIKQLDRFFKEGVESYRSRFRSWLRETKEAKKFYVDLVRDAK